MDGRILVLMDGRMHFSSIMELSGGVRDSAYLMDGRIDIEGYHALDYTYILQPLPRS